MVTGEIFQTDGIHVGNKPFYDGRCGISVCLWHLCFTDFSGIEYPCYIGINSSGKKACTFLLSSFGLMAGLSYMIFFGSCSLW